MNEKFFAVLCVLALPVPLVAQERFTMAGSDAAVLEIRAAVGPIRVDGVLDEPTWTDARPVDVPFETSPGDNSPAPVSTRCMISFDAEHLYFACRADDPRAREIRAYYTDRDEILGHDRIAIGFDPFNDARRAFEFSISPLGVQRDARFDVQSGWDGSWDAIWESAGRIDERGYTVEAAIPFKSMRFPATSEPQTWRYFVMRDWPRDDFVEMMSMRLDRSESCFLCQADLMTGVVAGSQGHNLEFVPTLTSGRTECRESFPAGDFRSPDEIADVDVGLSGRWGVTSNLTLNATVNPDFSQVEADVAQLDVNNRFALFFPERRPFFLETAEFYRTPVNAAFTRTIADPVAGGSFSGKIGANAFGTIVAQDRINNLLFPAALGSQSTTLDHEVTSLISRYRRDVGESNTVGGLYTVRVGDAYSNHVLGADAVFRPLTSWSFRAQYLHSETSYPDSTAASFDQPLGRFGGDAFDVRADYSTRNWDLVLATDARTADFRTDAGFTTQVDRRTLWGLVDGSLFSDGGHPWFTKLSFTIAAQTRESFDGDLVNQFAALFLEYDGPSQTEIDLRFRGARDRFAGQLFDIRDFRWDIDLVPSGNLQLNFTGVTGDAIDFTNARKAFQWQLEPWVRVRLGRHYEAEVAHTLQRLSRQGERIFTANVTELRSIYSFDARALLRVILQYRTVDRNLAQFDPAADLDRTESGLFSQLLFSYKVNAQTALFLGYSDDWVGRESNFESIGLTQTRRTLFMKLGYAWRP